MRSKISLPVIEHLRVHNYALYPGENGTGLDLSFKDGVTVLAGINGVGKTTLLNLLLRMLLGPMDPVKVDRGLSRVSEREVIPMPGFSYFKDRVPQKLTEKATATLRFRLGGHVFTVTRSLASMKLLSVVIDGNESDVRSESLYGVRLAKLSGLATPYDFHIVVRYLQFFSEERLHILWSSGTQFEFFKMLFLEAGLAQALDGAFATVQRLDSDYRNRRNQLTIREDRLAKDAAQTTPVEMQIRELDASIRAAETSHREVSEKHQSRQDRFTALQDEGRQLDAKLDQVEIDLAQAEQEFAHTEATYITQALPDLDDKLQFLMQGLGAGRGCFVCGNGGHKEVESIGRTLRDGNCFVCHAPVAKSIAKASNVTSLSAKKVRALEDKIATLKAIIADIEVRRGENRSAYEAATVEMKEISNERVAILQRLETLRANRPESFEEGSSIQADIEREKSELQELDSQRKAVADDYRKSIEIAKRRMDDVKEDIRSKLTHYAQAFLQEEVRVDFKTDKKVSIATGAGNVSIPTFSILMTSSTHPVVHERLSSESVSESQKEFLDLAFRMTLLDIVSKDGSAMMIMETPEASLDSWFMRRAAKLMRDFAPDKSAAPRKLIATSNLNGTVMIPALLGLVDDQGNIKKKLPRAGSPHLIDLLKLTAQATVLKSSDAREVLEKELERFTHG